MDMKDMSVPISYEEMVEMSMHTAVVVKPGVYAMRVPGGWVYQVIDEALAVNVAVFVPMPTHPDLR